MLKRIRNMKVYAKLMLLLGISLFSLAASSGFSLVSLNKVRIGSKTYLHIKAYDKSLESIALLKADLSQSRAVLISMLGERDTDKARQYKETLAELKIMIDESFAKLVSDLPDEELRTALADAQATWDEFKNTRDNELVPAFESGKLDLARELMTGVQRQRYERFIEQVSSAVDVIRLKIEEQEEHTKKFVLRTVVILSAISGIAFIVVILLTFLIVRMITRPLSAVTQAAIKVAEGDLRQNELPVLAQDEFGQLTVALNRMLHNLKTIVGQIGQTSESVYNSSQSLAQASEQATQSTSQLSNVVGQITQTTTSISKSAQNASTSSQNASDISRKGQERAKQLLSRMQTIQVSVSKSRAAIDSLGKRSVKIGEIVNVITKIAEQTNLLSLNAAIEAARAGESGKGFAVVADEIRKLAEHSAMSAQEISKLVSEVQQDTSSAVTVTESATKEVEEGGKMMLDTDQGLQEILSAVENVTRQIEQIAAATEELAASTEEASASSEEQNATIEEVSGSAQELSANAEELKKIVENFKV